MQENASFVSFDNKKNGLIFNDSKNEVYPISYYNLVGAEWNVFKGNAEKSYHVYVYDGDLTLDTTKKHRFELTSGNYFSIHGLFSLKGNGSAIIIESHVRAEKSFYKENKYTAMFHLGATEEQGRLKYIDGCTDSLLIPPVKFGDPCLNHLHFPLGIDQTGHTHPSHRIGIVAKGHGLCKTPFGNMELTAGMIFVIKSWDGVSFSKGLDGETYPNGQHSFQTFESSMDVIAFHPDSDFGATDEVHPMINRTIVDGISASKLENIRTK